MTERIHLSWSRDDEGVITIYATDENTGRIAEVADFWTKPMRERLGFRREYAKGVQQQLAETLVWNWNGPPGGAGDCHVAVAPEPETERLQKALADLLNRVEAHGCEKWFPHVVERARAALEAVMPEGEPVAHPAPEPGEELERVARAICAEGCAFRGEPPCWEIAPDEWPSPECNEPGCMALARAALAEGGRDE